MKRPFALAFVSSVVALFSACGDPVVGGDCAAGYEECDGRCVAAGTCGANPDAFADGSPDALDEVDGDASRDAPLEVDGSDAANDASDAADAPLVDGCPPPPYSSPSNCGACGVVCATDVPLCKAQPDGTFACASPCAPPEKLRGGVCVDTDIDPFNCGACGVFCPTGLCNGGVCRGARSGHVAAIGHDYSTSSPSSAAGKVVSNGVFLPSANPVRVLVLDQYADAAAETSVGKILDYTATTTGRSWKKTIAATSSDVLTRLGIDSFEVLLVLDQPKAPAGALATIGDDVKAKVTSFTETGGVVVVLDGGGGIGEMPSFLSASGLLAIRAHTGISGKTVDVIAPADAIGIDVLTPYLAASKSVTFTLDTPPSPTIVIVVDEPTSLAPVVIHRVVKKP